MTELLKQAFAATSALPEAEQDEIAYMPLELAGNERPVIILTPEERVALAQADAEIDRGEMISIEEATARWAKLGF